MKLSIYLFYCSMMATVANATGVGSLRGGPREQHSSSVLRELLLGGGVKDIGADKSNALKKALMPKKNIKEKKVKIPNLSSIVKNETKKVQEKLDKVETDKKKEKNPINPVKPVLDKKEKLPIKQVKPMLEKKDKIPVKPISPKRNGPANVDKDAVPSGVDDTPGEDKDNDESAGPAAQPKDYEDEDKEVEKEEDTSDDEKKESKPKLSGQSKDDEDEDIDEDAPKEVNDAPEEEKETPSTKPGEGPSSPNKD